MLQSWGVSWNSSPFTNFKISLPPSQAPASDPYPKEDNPIHNLNPISSRSNLILSPTYANVYKPDSSLLTLLGTFVISYITHTQPISIPSVHMTKRTNFEAPHPVFPSILLSFPRRNYSVFMYTSPQKQQFAVNHR
jgi:hypothetical protein